MRILLAVLAALILMTSQVWAEARFVQRVDDDGTLVLLNGERVHLIGLQAPNRDQFPQANADSADFIRGLVSGSVVELEYDIEKIDDDGNILAYVWFQFDEISYFETMEFPENYIVQYKGYENGEGTFFVFVNATVIKSGFALPRDDSPNHKYAKLFNNLFQQRRVKTASVFPAAPEETQIVTTNYAPR